MNDIADALRIAKTHPSEIGTRLITSKKAVDSRDNDVSMDAFRQTPDLFAKNVGLIRDYPGLRDKVKQAPDGELAENFINHVKGNLLWLHDQIPPEIRDRSKLWYDGANRIAQEWGKKYGLPPQSVAGALAVLSPQKDWFQNVSLAKRVIHTLKGGGNNFNNGFAFTPEMHRALANRPSLNKEEYAPVHQHIFGKSLGELNNLKIPDEEKSIAKAMWLRLHDEAHNPSEYPLVSPEGKEGDVVRNQGGAKAKVGWGSLGEIAKAIQAVESGGDQAKLHQLMGERHKVRNFFNNIISPNSPRGHVTIDTHAVAAGLLRPLSGNSLEVSHNFANYPGKNLPTAGGSATTGIQGTYPLYAEAYRRAARERGLLPRQMQSITWEGVRGLFPDTFKTENNNRHIDDLWNEYGKGRRSLNDTRQEILRQAGGIRNPDWASPSGPVGQPNEATGNPGNSGNIRNAGINGGQKPSQPVRGGRAGGFASGGAARLALSRVVPDDADSAIRIARAHGGHVGLKLHVGPIHSAVAGRTDHLPVHVPSGAYVLPADIVSGMGEGNTQAGFRVVKAMLGHLKRRYSGVPYGGEGMPYGGNEGPYGQAVGHADGGSVKDPVACVLAGGEHVLTPEQVTQAGDGDAEAGHKALDAFVKQYRARLVKTLQGLPGPRQD